jgi:hypothetical protein
MRKPRQVLVLLLVGLVVLSAGCLRKTITDRQIEEKVKAFIDSSPDASDENSLTAEEKASVERFNIVRNTIKVQLVEGTDQAMWSPIGSKMTRAFAVACREARKFQPSYYCELWIVAQVEGKSDNFQVAEVTFNNQSERINVELYSPSRRRR